MIGQSAIIAPSGEIVSMCHTLGDELIVHRCDLDFGKRYKDDIFNFVAHRQAGALSSHRRSEQAPFRRLRKLTSFEQSMDLGRAAQRRPTQGGQRHGRTRSHHS